MLVLVCFALSFGLLCSAPADETVSLREKRSTFATGIVSQRCLQCICELESGCHACGCHMNVNSDLRCGYFQIKESYWKDCGSPGSSWRACADDMHCASRCVQNYMKKFASHNHCPLTCEGFARTHNGGPGSCRSSATLAYWSYRETKAACSNL